MFKFENRYFEFKQTNADLKNSNNTLIDENDKLKELNAQLESNRQNLEDENIKLTKRAKQK